MRPSLSGRRAGRGDEQRAEDRDGRHFSGRGDCGTGGTGIPLRRGIMSVRKRIGVMVPSTNTTCEADFNLVVPRGITVHGQRRWITNDATGDAAYQRMNGEIETGARYLATARVDVIAYGCTTGSFYRGPGWDREMIDTIGRVAGVPAVATSPSVVEALRFFGAKKISVATPYPEWNNGRLRAYLEAQGFEVLNVEG